MWPAGDMRCYYSRIAGVYDWWFLKSQHRRAVYIAAASFFLLTMCLILAFHRNSNLCYKRRKMCTCNLIVPDIIHFYRNGREVYNISVQESLCLKAARRLHDQVWVHTTNPESTSQQMTNMGMTSPSFKVLQAPYGPGPAELSILRKYGGIFLKNDIYLIDRLDDMRGHEWSSAGKNDIIAGTQDGIASGKQFKLKDILLDKNYGALYIRDIMQNCSHLAVRLGVR